MLASMRCKGLRFSWMKDQVEPILPVSIATPSHSSIDEPEDSGSPEQDSTTNSPKDHLRMAREMKIPSYEMNARIQKSEYAQGNDIYDPMRWGMWSLAKRCKGRSRRPVGMRNLAITSVGHDGPWL